ncbi:MAG: hypothetical protein KBD16_03360 [Candidatus Pacebacteria bacterium]|nr:hypothetical protein [Candidatus Paceibacterota bacterium]
MNKHHVAIAFIIGLLIGLFLPSFKSKDTSEDFENKEESKVTEQTETVFVGFDDTPDALQAINEHIIKYKDSIAPDPELEKIKLLYYDRVVWPNNCLVFWENTPTRCVLGSYPGYLVLLSIDNDLQIWKTTDDEELIYGAGGVGKYQNY